MNMKEEDELLKLSERIKRLRKKKRRAYQRLYYKKHHKAKNAEPEGGAAKHVVIELNETGGIVLHPCKSMRNARKVAENLSSSTNWAIVDKVSITVTS